MKNVGQKNFNLFFWGKILDISENVVHESSLVSDSLTIETRMMNFGQLLRMLWTIEN